MHAIVVYGIDLRISSEVLGTLMISSKTWHVLPLGVFLRNYS